MISHTLSFIAATAMLAHAIFGCCWHHAHEQGGASGYSASYEALWKLQETQVCTHQHGHDHSATQHDGRGTGESGHECPHGPIPCDHDPCYFLMSVVVNCDIQLNVARLDGVPLLVGDLDRVVEHWREVDREELHATDSRRHTVLCVWQV